MKKMFMAVIAMMMTISASAQFYIYFSDGTVTKVDSISMIAPESTDTPDIPIEPEEPTTPSTGIGVFSVSADKQVTFSKGNLQYHPANDEWRFAENQTDYIGSENRNCSSTYNGWLDLFGWSTSATNFGVSTSEDNNYYSGSFVDWGTNQIGSDAPNTWRTLTYDEWEYLLNNRPNANDLVGVAQVNGVNGLIFLPDNWTCPAGVTFKSGYHSSYGVDYYAAYQTFTAEQWSKLESAGAVFLPAAGFRFGSYVGDDVQFYAYYWSATEYGSDGAYYLGFYSGEANMNYNGRCIGKSVRLVKDLSNNSDTPDNPNQSETAELCLESADERAVFFHGLELGTSVNVYMWIRDTYTDLVGAWPGSAAIPIGDGTFKFVVPANVTSSPSKWMIIWNGNGKQTDDLTFTMHGFYNMNGYQGTITALCEENTPGEPTTPSTGIGVFSVSADKQVTFSKGNLQYHPANDEWRFAENQTDYIGSENRNCSSTYNGWLDLFGWSTSATNFGVSTSTDWEYGYSGSFVDWGTNKIGNDAPNTWRTLSYDEWYYLRYTRTNAGALCGVAQVNGVNGLIFLPDNWTCPSGVTFKSGFHSSYGVDYYAAYQTFTADQWSKLEAAGAVFLPASGGRGGSIVNRVQYGGHYWSATEYDSYYAYFLGFFSDEASMSCGNRDYGQSVRLVKDL